MAKCTRFVGLDVHAETIAVAVESPRVSQRLRKLGEWKPWEGRASSHRKFESELAG